MTDPPEIVNSEDQGEDGCVTLVCPHGSIHVHVNNRSGHPIPEVNRQMILIRIREQYRLKTGCDCGLGEVRA